jgi:hypothetical protein
VKTVRTHRRQQRRKQTDIRNWMEQADVTGPPLSHWPTIDSRVTHGNNEWSRRYSLIPERTTRPRHISDARSAASDPANIHSLAGLPPRYVRHDASAVPEPGYRDMTDADGDGDDELVTNDEEEEEQITNAEEEGTELGQHEVDDEEYFTTPVASQFNNTETSSLDSASQDMVSPQPQGALNIGRKALHHRTMSSNTILFSPQAHADSSDGTIEGTPRLTNTRQTAGVQSPGPNGRRSAYNTAARSRPVISRGLAETLATAGRTPFIGFDATARNRPARPRIPSMDMSITSDNVNIMAEDAANVLSSSFQTQMVMAMEKNRMLARASSDSNDTSDRLSKLVLSRIGQMEQNLADVAKEMRELRGSGTISAAGTAANSSSENIAGQGSAQNSRGHSRTQSTQSSSGLPRKTGLRSRPGSRRSLKDASRLTLPPDVKGKGRDMGTTPERAEHDADDGFTMGRRQSPH